MEARQRVKLSLTNRPIGLIALIRPCPLRGNVMGLFSRLAPTGCGRLSAAGRNLTVPPTHEGSGLSSLFRALGRWPTGKVLLKNQLPEKMRCADLVASAGWPHPIPFRTRP
nr:putative two-component system response regulator [Aureimonas sp. AU4]BAT30481.1 putative two-component system response regulator [Aureimonas sp. AU4]